MDLKSYVFILHGGNFDKLPRGFDFQERTLFSICVISFFYPRISHWEMTSRFLYVGLDLRSTFRGDRLFYIIAYEWLEYIREKIRAQSCAWGFEGIQIFNSLESFRSRGMDHRYVL